MPFRRRKQQQQQLTQWETIFWFRTSIVAGCMLSLWCGLLAFEHYSCPGLTCWRIHSSIPAADGTRRRTSSSLVFSVATAAAENHHLSEWAAEMNVLRKVQQPQLPQQDVQPKLSDDESSLKQSTSMRTQKLSDGEKTRADTASNDVESHTLQQALARKHEKQLPPNENEMLVSQSSTETLRFPDKENEAVERNILHNEEEWLTREMDHELLLHQHHHQQVKAIKQAEDDVNLQQRAESSDKLNSFLPAGQQNFEEKQNENAELSVLHKEEEWLMHKMDHELLLLQQYQPHEASIEEGSAISRSSPLARDAAVELETLRKDEEWVAKELRAEGVQQLPQPQDPMLHQQQTKKIRFTSFNVLNRMELENRIELDILRK